MIYIGLDVHKLATRVATLDDQTGELSSGYSVPTAELVGHLRGLEQPLRVALECGSQSTFLATALKSWGIEVLVVDAAKASVLVDLYTRTKTDKLDAQCLALLLAKGHLDSITIWVPDEQIARLRELVRARSGFVQAHTRACNWIRKLLTRHLKQCDSTDLSAPGAAARLDALAAELPPETALILANYRRLLAAADAGAAQMARAMTELCRSDEQVALVKSIPGAGEIIAPTVIAQIGEISRFGSPEQLCSYAGLAPQVKQSGERSHTGPLPHRGNPELRTAMIHLAGHFSRHKELHDLALMRSYWRTYHKYGPNPAKVALARKLLRIIYAMLRDGSRFDAARLAA